MFEALHDDHPAVVGGGVYGWGGHALCNAQPGVDGGGDPPWGDCDVHPDDGGVLGSSVGDQAQHNRQCGAGGALADVKLEDVKVKPPDGGVGASDVHLEGVVVGASLHGALIDGRGVTGLGLLGGHAQHTESPKESNNSGSSGSHGW
jgi:hypothetical protein